MKHVTYVLVVLVCLVGGCRSSRSVLCIGPQGEFEPETEAEFLAEVNSELPFRVREKDFMAKEKSSGFVGWVVVKNDRQKDAAKAELKESSTLKLLQVEELSAEFEALMKQRKK